MTNSIKVKQSGTKLVGADSRPRLCVERSSRGAPPNACECENSFTSTPSQLSGIVRGMDVVPLGDYPSIPCESFNPRTQGHF
jgi:hypothetical protein